jgi:hypothetical protein
MECTKEEEIFFKAKMAVWAPRPPMSLPALLHETEVY